MTMRDWLREENGDHVTQGGWLCRSGVTVPPALGLTTANDAEFAGLVAARHAA